MGLDILAVSRIVKKEDGDILIGENESRCEYKAGEYSPGQGSTSNSFRAGSYSGYNAWRAKLCKLMHGIQPEEMWADPNRWSGAAFQEVIDFSDCEGVIGARVSKKLYTDFKKHRSQLYQKAIELFSQDDVAHFFAVYDDFTTAFKISADRGLLIFC